jgi:hypothetical protein
MDRRRFLASVPLVGMGLAHTRGSPGGYRAEAERLTDLIQQTFWDRVARQYKAPVRSAESVDSDPVHDQGYVLWPCVEALHALAEATAVVPRRYRAVIREVVEGLEQYFDPAAHAYNAWLRFPGNRDRYFDDNALMVIALAKAARYTGEGRYRDRAAEVMGGYLREGWDGSGKPGGMRWGTDPGNPATADRAACSTSMCALAALWLARLGTEPQANVAWAEELLSWLRGNLQDADGLIMDALEPPNWTVRRVKWTYNTGVALRAHVELHRQTGSAEALAAAQRLAAAAIDRTGALYDSLVADPANRFWYDSSFFVPYLVDGLMGLYAVTRRPALLAEVRRNGAYAGEYLRDPADGLYFRNWRLWRIGPEQLRAWETLTGQTHPLEPDDSERSKERRYDSTPLAARPLVKTLLANAGMARLCWVLGRNV